MEIKQTKRWISMHNNSTQIIIARNYWRALKKAQKWFNSNTQVRVWEDRLSTTNGVR